MISNYLKLLDLFTFVMLQTIYIYFVILLGQLVQCELFCYSCTSAQSGCGDPIDVRLMHWKRCTGRRVIEDYCVKLIVKVADQKTVTRGCLSDLLLNTQYRLDMPQLRRHGYCVNSRSYQQYLLISLRGKSLAEAAMGVLSGEHEDYKRFCYCNDFNGCNNSQNVNYSLVTFIISMIIHCTVNNFLT